MDQIFKYPIKITDTQSIRVDGFVSILKIAEQDHQLYMWCVTRIGTFRSHELKVHIVGTGNPMPDIQSKDHFESIVMKSGFVWHIFIPGLKQL